MSSHYSKSLITKLLNNNAEIILCGQNNKMSEHDTLDNCLILSGAFNPLHLGHIKLAESANKLLNKNVLFDLSVMNADKGLMTVSEICSLLDQFDPSQQVVLTRKPLFSQKSVCFPNTTFIVGYDTALRILQKKYYDDSHKAFLSFLYEFKKSGCKFLVAGRLWNNEFSTIKNLNIPSKYNGLFVELPENAFRIDTSSSLLRKIKQGLPSISKD